MTEKTVYDFYADWCGPCKTQDNILEEFEENHPEVDVERVDVEESENDELVQKYSVRSLPTLVALEDGEVVGQFIGVTQEEEIKNAFES